MVALYSIDRASLTAAEANNLSPLAALRAFARVTDPGSVTRAEPLGVGREPEECVGVIVDLVLGLALVARRQLYPNRTILYPSGDPRSTTRVTPTIPEPPWSLVLPEHHLLVGGESGAGTSVTVSLVLAHAALKETTARAGLSLLPCHRSTPSTCTQHACRP
jgi:hypothetical protein